WKAPGTPSPRPWPGSGWDPARWSRAATRRSTRGAAKADLPFCCRKGPPTWLPAMPPSLPPVMVEARRWSVAPIEVRTVEQRRYEIRPVDSDDFRHLRLLEQEIWSGDAAGMLCPYYLRLCTEFYSDWCFIAMDGERPVGYVLNFPKGKVNYCATLAVHPDYHKTRVNYLLIRAMVKKLIEEEMEECRFLVEPGNRDARS